MWYLFGTFFSFFFLFLRGKPPLLSQSVCSSFDHMGNFKILKQALCFVCYTTYLNECYNPCFIWLKCNFKRVDISSWVFSFCKPIFERWVILEVCINELLFFVKLGFIWSVGWVVRVVYSLCGNLLLFYSLFQFYKFLEVGCLNDETFRGKKYGRR